jgi:hypothetical protein
MQPNDAPAAIGPTNTRAADVEHWERDAASVLDVLGGMEPTFCEVIRMLKKLVVNDASRLLRSWLECAV